jgi:hypothetical protein
MNAIRWFFISLPFVGLIWLFAKMVIRDRRMLPEMAVDSEAFARAKAPPVEMGKPVKSDHSLTNGLEAHG